MESIQINENQPTSGSPDVIRAGSATGDLRIHKFKSQVFRNTRFIRVWLPPGYDERSNQGRRYPILYLNDGQNLFESATSFTGVEWQVDETADRLIRERVIDPMIVVGIDNGAKDGLIRISVTDRNPQRAAEMANGYVEEFKRLSAHLAVTEASQRRLFFEQQLAQAKDNLANAEEDLKKTGQKTGLIQLDSQTRATIELLANLRGQIAAKEVEISAMRSFATGENPDLQMAEQQLAGLRSQEQKMGANSEGATNALIPKGNAQEVGIEYIRKLRDVKYFETIFDLLARQYEMAKVDEARQGAVVQIVDRAIVPDRRSSPQRTLIVLGAAAFGMFFGVVWAFAREGLTRLSNNPAQQHRLELLKKSISPRKKQEIRP